MLPKTFQLSHFFILKCSLTNLRVMCNRTLYHVMSTSFKETASKKLPQPLVAPLRVPSSVPGPLSGKYCWAARPCGDILPTGARHHIPKISRKWLLHLASMDNRCTVFSTCRSVISPVPCANVAIKTAIVHELLNSRAQSPLDSF